MKAIQRLYEYLELKGIKPGTFERQIQLSQGYLSKMYSRNADMGEGIILQIIENCPEINLMWLMTGRGNMFKEATDKPIQITNLQPTAATISQQSIPVYDLQMGAQPGALLDGGLTPISYISLPNLPQCDGAMVLYGGDSMSPALESGDILVYKRVKDIRRGLFLGHMYIVTFEMEGEEYLLVRRIEKSEDKNSLKLVSNKVSQDILYDSIKGIAMVKASVRRYEP